MCFGRSGAPLAGIVLCSALLKTAEPGNSPKIAAPVLALHGSMDVVCPLAVVQDLINEMDRARNDFRVVIYGRTHHAFYDPSVGTDPSARLVYSPEADRAAGEELRAFSSAYPLHLPIDSAAPPSRRPCSKQRSEGVERVDQQPRYEFINHSSGRNQVLSFGQT